MSAVISFRLDPDNPREAQALDVLQQMSAEGFSNRFIITEALIRLRETNLAQKKDMLQSEISQALSHLNLLVTQLSDGQGIKTVENRAEGSNMPLSQAFLSSIKTAVKPGTSNPVG